MTRKNKNKFLSFVLSIMLIVAMAYNMTGCNGDLMENPLVGAETSETVDGTDETGNTGLDAKEETETDVTVLGEGETIFEFTVVDAEGKAKLSFYPWQLFFPALILCLIVLAFNLLGDALRDALDPRTHR